MEEYPPQQEKKRRLFVAIPLPAEIQANLESLQKQFKPFARDAKWVKVEGIHLTLKFLGYVSPERVQAIQESLNQIRCPAFAVEAKGCGFFPNSRRPAVLWVGIHSDQIVVLQTGIEDAMAKLGFEKEKRAFSPHLTLARFRDPRGLIPLAQETAKHKDGGFGRFDAEEFVLYESILRPRRAEYQAIQRFTLK